MHTKPCPFCGSTNIGSGEILRRKPNGEGYSQNVCYDCGAAGPYAKLRSGEVDYGHEKADAAWNRRAVLEVSDQDRPTVAIGSLRIEHFWGDSELINTYLDYYGDLPEGSHTIYAVN